MKTGEGKILQPLQKRGYITPPIIIYIFIYPNESASFGSIGMAYENVARRGIVFPVFPVFCEYVG